jgi:Uma2 family endonuclease
MPTVIHEEGTLQIPQWVKDLASFRRWAESDDFPEEGRICFIQGEVWADMSRQQIFSHIRVRSAIDYTLAGLARKLGTGMYLPNGLRLYCEAADLSAVPDGSYTSYEALRTGRLQLVEGREGGFTAVDGAPELVIEVVSDSSEDKDNEWQMRIYLDAGVREYWIVDARRTPLRFDIYRAGAKGFTPVRKVAGWLKSAVFGKSFRLDVTKDPLENPDYVLRVK